MTIACLISVIAIPFVEKKVFNNEVGYYSIEINGQEIGAANSRVEAEEALASARMRYSQENEAVVYMDNSINIVEKNKLASLRMNKEDLSEAIYSSLDTCVTDREELAAYTVRIDDFTVTLASKDDVVELMEKVIDKYDTKNEFQVKLTSGKDVSNGSYSVDMIQSELRNTATDIVAAAIDGATTVTASDGTSNRDGITNISFEQSVVVNETLAEGANIMSVADAYEEITKEKAEKTYYVVEEGDTLYGIAGKCGFTLNELLALNKGIDEDTVIRPGDRLVVTEPKSGISVIVTERKTYEEEYEAEVQYVDDDTAYVGTYTVQSEGTPGYHKVTADITYVNGNKTEVKYISEDIIKPAVAKVVASGTITPPTYVKPIAGGSVSSGYGYRDGSLHKGIDWQTGIGTPVKAAASGTVLRAGFYSSYGNCVDIQHSDGSMTRYAHLNSVEVKAGQTVEQGALIAYSGNTGYSTGPHLHFEIWIDGATVNPLNYVNR